jgi:hypothetical protein
MYPRNAASPEPIAIGAVVQISDGAVQTSGCTVRIKPIGVAEADGAGTTAYSTDGIVLYTPTQGETNYTSFILIAKKTGCIPACVTVVTTASSVPGRTVPADGSITAAVIATDAIDADAIKADAVTEIQSGLSTLTQTQVTGGAYALNSASFAFNSGLDFTTAQKAATLARVTLVDTTTTNTDMRGTDNAALAATALSTATWTNGLATNLGTTNSTVATNLDATVSSRLAATSYTAPANSDITAIKAKTDNLPSDPADQSAVEAAITAATSPLATAANLATVAGYLDTEIAAILADTNELQLDWADGGRLDLILDARSSQASVDDLPTNAELATALGTADDAVLAAIATVQSDTNDIQTRLPAALESGRIAAALDSATTAQITAIETFATRVTTGIVQDGAVWQFTENMLELGPSGGGGGSGDATLAKQEEILTQLDVIQTKTDMIGSVGAITSLLAAAVLEPGTITSFPETLTIGDSYTEQNGREIQIPIVDTDGTPLSSTGSLNFADASVAFTLQRSGETDSTRVITGTATFVDPPGTGTGAGAPYAVIELPASETAKGLKKYKYSGILTFLWTGTGTDVMSFETDTVTFDN